MALWYSKELEESALLEQSYKGFLFPDEIVLFIYWKLGV